MPKALHSVHHVRFRALLVERRTQAGLTQQAVADRLSRPQSFVAKYEGGERRLDVVEFLDVADAIGFDPAELVDQLRQKVSANRKR